MTLKHHEFFFVILAFVSEVVGTLSGVSSSALFVPVGVLLESLQITLALTACLHVLGNSMRLVLYWKDINWPLTLKFGVLSVLMAGFGAQYADYFPKQIFSILLGSFLICLAFIFLRKKESRLFQGRYTPYLGGALSGLLTGMLGSGGAVRSLALSGFVLTPFAFTATSTLIDLGGDIFRLKIYLEKGFLPKDHYFYVPILMLAAFLANLLAEHFLKKISQEKFKKIVLNFVLMTGLISLVTGLLQIGKINGI